MFVEILEVELANCFLLDVFKEYESFSLFPFLTFYNFFLLFFFSYLDVVKVCCDSFSDHLYKDVQKVLEGFTNVGDSQDVLDIAAKLDRSNDTITQKFPAFTPIPVHELFPGFIYARIDTVAEQTEQWVEQECNEEDVSIKRTSTFQKAKKKKK